MEITLDTQIEDLEERIAPSFVSHGLPDSIHVTQGAGVVMNDGGTDFVPPPEISVTRLDGSTFVPGPPG